MTIDIESIIKVNSENKVFDIAKILFQYTYKSNKFLSLSQYLFFINFNYTDVLELLYKIPEERVLHIHGRSSKRDRLIYGHGKLIIGSFSDDDEEKVSFALSWYNKKTYKYINEHPELKEIIKDVEYVHIFGFSFSPIDEDYIDWVFKNVASSSRWEVSWFSEKDRNRIDKFVLDHMELKERLNLVRLEDIPKN